MTMKNSIKVLSAFIIVLFLTSMVSKPKKILFFGDSITEMGVKAGGYVSLIKKSLDPSKYEVIGAGIGGNKIYDLYLRLEDDVLNKNPDLVVIYIGVNDVWHKQSLRTGTDQDKFVKFYQALINKITAKGAQVILCTPAVIGEQKNGSNEMDAELDKYAAEIRKLATSNKLPLVDLRSLFDGVHLNDKGNQMVAAQLLPLIK